MKKAVIVGINNYPQYPLTGCVNDALDYQTTLLAKGFSVTLITNSQGTKANILNNLQYMVSNSVSGDSLVFAYSGHGSKVPDTNGDEPDQYDEVLCPIDFFSGQYISDDDLRAIFSGLPSGVTLDVFLDSCYSGTATRCLDLVGVKSRCIPGPITNGAKAARVVTLVPDLNHVLWSGCKDNQTSSEVSVNGVVRGVFSYYVLKAIRIGGLRASLITAVQNAVASKVANQTPQLECSQAESTQLPFT